MLRDIEWGKEALGMELALLVEVQSTLALDTEALVLEEEFEMNSVQ